MASILDRLVAVAGPALAPPLPDTRPVPTPLVGLLLRANGFFAFGSALHVLPCEPVPPGTMSLQRWNDIDL